MACSGKRRILLSAGGSIRAQILRRKVKDDNIIIKDKGIIKVHTCLSNVGERIYGIKARPMVLVSVPNQMVRVGWW
jgi:hypothetical protein